MQPVIRFENVGKLYRLGTVGTGTISHDLRRWWITSVMHKEDPYLKIGETNDRSTKGSSDYVYALKDINLEVQEGDVLGIIGKNGAGKSTLLKLLSRVTAPTTGKIYTNGRIATLLEVGTGFHPELTGRENIYMNGAILGMKKWEINKRLDEIIDFSGCERYIDTPVKRYSSGMMVRLGFAVAAHLDPEILVVDEVLAVGDAEFQKKAIGKMQEVSKGKGRTVLFVSHNMQSVRALCRTGIILNNGEIQFYGNIEDVVAKYLSSNSINNIKKQVCATDAHRIYSADHNKGILFQSFEFCKDVPKYSSDEEIKIMIVINSSVTIDDVRINCTIFDKEETPIGTCSSFEKIALNKGENKIIYTVFPTRLVAGIYSISFSIGKGNTTEGETNYDVVTRIIQFEIDRLHKSQKHFYSKWDSGWGVIYFDTKTQVIR